MYLQHYLTPSSRVTQTVVSDGQALPDNTARIRLLIACVEGDGAYVAFSGSSPSLYIAPNSHICFAEPSYTGPINVISGSLTITEFLLNA
jgi:hypothetical protein